MMALNASTSYIPRLVMVNVPFATSAGFKRPPRARSVSSLRVWAIVEETQRRSAGLPRRRRRPLQPWRY